MLDEKSTEELIKDLLEKRGQESQHQIEKFINPDYSDLKNPFDFENMEDLEALSRLDKSVSEELSRALMVEEPKNLQTDASSK